MFIVGSRFLPRDITQSAVMTQYKSSVRLSVRPSVTFKYDFHIGWNTSKIISRSNSLSCVLTLTPNISDLVQQEHLKIEVE